MFDLGWGFWVLFFVIFFGCGRMCGWGARKYRQRQRDLDHSPVGSDRLTDLESRVKQLDERERARERWLRPATLRAGEGESRQPALVKRRSKSPLQDLQEKFIEGRLSLADYERELDRLERLE